MSIAGSIPVVSAMAIIIMIMQVFLLNTPVPSMKRPQTPTPVSERQLLDSLKEGHVAFFGTEPSYRRLASAWAQVSLENGQGSKVYNFNFGNIGGSKREPYFFINGHPFKANDSVIDGTVLYWKTIKKMCPSVLPYFDVGNAKGAAYQLYRCGYYRSDKEDYARGMSQLYWKAIKM